MNACGNESTCAVHDVLGSSASGGGRLPEECGDALAGDTEEVGDRLDREPLGPKRKSFGNSELCTCCFEHGLVGGQELDHPGLLFTFDKGDEIISGLEPLPQISRSLLQLAAAFDVALGGRLDLGERGEESYVGFFSLGHGLSEARPRPDVNGCGSNGY
jgi:hypothetical protein